MIDFESRQWRNPVHKLGLGMALMLAFVPLLINAKDKGKKMAPEHVRLDIAPLHAVLEFSLPAYRAASVEETPYQLLRLCDAGGHCATLVDARGGGGISIANQAVLSPDQLYVLVQRMTVVDAANMTFRAQYTDIIGLKEKSSVEFRSASGKSAGTDNILGWASTEPHALTLSAGWKKTMLATPGGD